MLKDVRGVTNNNKCSFNKKHTTFVKEQVQRLESRINNFESRIDKIVNDKFIDIENNLYNHITDGSVYDKKISELISEHALLESNVQNEYCSKINTVIIEQELLDNRLREIELSLTHHNTVLTDLKDFVDENVVQHVQLTNILDIKDKDDIIKMSLTLKQMNRDIMVEICKTNDSLHELKNTPVQIDELFYNISKMNDTVAHISNDVNIKLNYIEYEMKEAVNQNTQDLIKIKDNPDMYDDVSHNVKIQGDELITLSRDVATVWEGFNRLGVNYQQYNAKFDKLLNSVNDIKTKLENN